MSIIGTTKWLHCARWVPRVNVYSICHQKDHPNLLQALLAVTLQPPYAGLEPTLLVESRGPIYNTWEWDPGPPLSVNDSIWKQGWPGARSGSGATVGKPDFFNPLPKKDGFSRGSGRGCPSKHSLDGTSQCTFQPFGEGHKGPKRGVCCLPCSEAHLPLVSPPVRSCFGGYLCLIILRCGTP